ncbi:enoyl-CoA hydratase-related protein [Nocardia sp. AG03]|uniref:enoyl-CoA hydratase-related protein n=1 Tax=Nocardia sp. AG03 TaxID=3025312 RepID=UPI002418A325|nr:enoyl-CoA hydratase-related protein [Nocardia sp. AG03]
MPALHQQLCWTETPGSPWQDRPAPPDTHDYPTLTYERDGRIARLTFNRPDKGNAITADTPLDLAHAVERADLDPRVHVILVSGRGKGFCGGYDLDIFAESGIDPETGRDDVTGTTVDPVAQAINHNPWAAAGMWAHRLGDQRAKRLLFTGDCISGAQAAQWGLAVQSCPAEELDERTEEFVARIARMPVNQLMMAKLALNSALNAQGVANSGMISTVFDGISRHTREGYAFQLRSATAGFREAVRERDEPFGDHKRRQFED